MRLQSKHFSNAPLLTQIGFHYYLIQLNYALVKNISFNSDDSNRNHTICKILNLSLIYYAANKSLYLESLLLN